MCVLVCLCMCMCTHTHMCLTSWIHPMQCCKFCSCPCPQCWDNIHAKFFGGVYGRINVMMLYKEYSHDKIQQMFTQYMQGIEQHKQYYCICTDTDTVNKPVTIIMDNKHRHTWEPQKSMQGATEHIENKWVASVSIFAANKRHDYAHNKQRSSLRWTLWETRGVNKSLHKNGLKEHIGSPQEI
jgi:hypothetical protein